MPLGGFGEMLCQGPGDEAAKNVLDDQGAHPAIRLPERDDSSKARSCQHRRQHVRVGEPKCCLVEQGEIAGVVEQQAKVTSPSTFAAPVRGNRRLAAKEHAAANVKSADHRT